MIKKRIYLAVAITLMLSGKAFSYEEEDAVPLTVAAYAGGGDIGEVSVNLHNQKVQVLTEIANKKRIKKNVGFAVFTPFYTNLGYGENHANKTFSDLVVRFNQSTIKPKAYLRGYFLGVDITAKLIHAGISPLPNDDANSKPIKYRGLLVENWQGYVSYSWVNELGPISKNMLSIEYRALPQFGLDDISSERFRRHISQHCGSVDQVVASIKNQHPLLQYIYFDRYEIPINYLPSRAVKMKVAQSPKKDAGTQPLFSLACGVSNRTGDPVNFSGDINEPGKVLSILVISKFPGSLVGDRSE